MRSDEIHERRNQWLRQVKKLVISLLCRSSIMEDSLCPTIGVTTEEERKQSLKDIASIDGTIRRVCAAISVAEQGDVPLGARALLQSDDINDATLSGIALLVAARHDRDVAGHVSTVADIVTLAGGRDPVAAAELRQTFRLSDGILREHVRMVRMSPNLDENRIAMRPSSLSRCLALDFEAEEMALELVAPRSVNSKSFE